jgi:hypothetical protein
MLVNEQRYVMHQQPLAYQTPTFKRDTGSCGAVATIALVLWAAVAGLPGAFLFCVYTSFLSAALYLRRFPSYGQPDPKTLPVSVTFTWSMFPVVFVALTIASAFLCRYFFRNSLKAQFVLIGAVAATMWFFVIVDPFGAFNWFAD